MSYRLKNTIVKITIIITFIFSSFICQAKVLKVPEKIQEQDEWCWAGVSQSILAYYGKNIEQCTIAEFRRTEADWHDFGNDNCCNVPNGKCNYWNYAYGGMGLLYDGTVADILEHWGVSSWGVFWAISKSEVEDQISNHRPFVIRWEWNTNGGHFLTGHGIEDNTLYYMDPWFGEGYKFADYSWVDSGGNHEWEDTVYVTNSPSCACSVENSCCDGCRLVENSIEICDGIDNDCNGQVDDGFGTTSCGKGQCEHTINNCENGSQQSCNAMDGYSQEVCDNIDNDCNGLIDENLGTTTCGISICEHTISNCENGIQQICDAFENALDEICDGIDNNCNGEVDEDLYTKRGKFTFSLTLLLISLKNVFLALKNLKIILKYFYKYNFYLFFR